MIFDMLNRLKSVVYLPGDFVCKKVSNMALFFFFSFFYCACALVLACKNILKPQYMAIYEGCLSKGRIKQPP